MPRPSDFPSRSWSGLLLDMRVLTSVPFFYSCLCAQMGCIAHGLLWQSSKSKHLKFVFAASILLGFILLILSGNSAERIGAARGLVAIVILILLVVYLYMHRSRHPWAVSVISGFLLIGNRARTAWHSDRAALGWEYQPFAGDFQCLGAYRPVQQHDRLVVHRLQQYRCQQRGSAHRRRRQLRRRVESTDHGICEIDQGGHITFVNTVAAKMLAVSGEDLSEAWIQEKLIADDNESSIRAISEFVLRLAGPIQSGERRTSCARTGRQSRWNGPPLPVFREGKSDGRNRDFVRCERARS